MPRLLSFLFVSFLLSLPLQGQSGLTKENYASLKSLKIENLDRDTYVVFDKEGFILDRYDLKPAYVFNFSDGEERRLYLYLVYPLETEDTLGFVLFYRRSSTTIALPIPGPGADKDTWGLYIDDLKYTGEAESGFLATISFVLSKEMAGLLQGAGGSTEEEGEYEYCFPAGVEISMADGSSKPVEQIRPGDMVASWDQLAHRYTPARITGLDVHYRESISLTELWYVDADAIWASTTGHPGMSSLQLTPNHPVLTAEGKKAAREIQPGNTIYLETSEGIKAVTVVAQKPVKQAARVVYSPTTAGATFLANHLVVFPK
ncbi:MAG: Hint domain-containing protein [Bacteroidia bacterium]|nr:Hint domain-containing protein [Bacteroidia bacterium]